MQWLINLWAWYPPVGVFIGLLAAIGVLVPWFRGPINNHKERALWAALMVLCALLEIKSIYQDRNKHDREQADARTEQLQKFREIAEGIKQGVTESQQQFITTMRGSDKIMKKAEEAASFSSGGDTIPTIQPETITEREGAHEIGFYLVKRGAYPLYNLDVLVGPTFRASLTQYQTQTLGAHKYFPEVDDASTRLILLQPVPSEKITFYTAYVTGRAHRWEEVIEVRKDDSKPWPNLSWRYVIEGFDNSALFDSRKQLMDFASEGYPKEHRAVTIYPVDLKRLPLLREATR